MNLITAITNITAIVPIYFSWSRGDTITAGLTAIAATASAVSHLFESHKHQMWGFGMPPYWSWALNRWDVASVALLTARCIWLTRNPWTWSSENRDWYAWFLPVLALNFISELDPGYMMYLPIHSIWHFCIFLVLNNFLTRVKK